MEKALNRIGALYVVRCTLYQVEQRLANWFEADSHQGRRRYRCAQAVPLLTNLRKWLQKLRPEVLPKVAWASDYLRAELLDGVVPVRAARLLGDKQ